MRMRLLGQSISLVLLLVLAAPCVSHGKIVGWWKLDEGVGTSTADSSGNGYNGTVVGAVQWVAGQYGRALQFDGTSTYVNCGVIPISSISTGGLSVAAWINQSGGTDNKVCSNIQVASAAGGGFTCAIYNGRMEMDLEDATGRLLSRDATRPVVPGVNTWTHMAWVYDDTANALKLYTNGTLNTTATVTQSIGVSTQFFRIGSNSPTLNHYYAGIIDDLRLYDHALSDAEVTNAMKGLSPNAAVNQATNPKPADKQTDVRRDVVLSWTPSPAVKTHNVYFGTSLDDVNAADKNNPRGVLVGAGQDANTYDPIGLLALDQTYYWRVDEVNGAPDFTVFRGNVWSFTAEPTAYKVPSVTATASSSYTASTGASKTVDGSGLNAQDQHGTAPDTMWLSASEPNAWILYQFDRVYSLYQMWVWNSNQSVEGLIGLGIKGVRVEYSTNGQAWTTLAGVTQFAQAPGTETYTHNTTVDFHGVAAQFVRITPISSWGGRTQYGLSEVRFYYTPAFAREPQPANGLTGVDPSTILSWRSGRNAVSHKVHFGADPNAWSLTDTTSQTSYTPASLKLGATYYWSIDEVNQADAISTWVGDVWSFSTKEYNTIDDFESYNDTDNQIFNVWVDGYGTTTNGSQVGKGTSANGTFGETTIVHGGKQSMPFAYNNAVTAVISEAIRTWDTAQDWTTDGADTLSLYFRGIPIGFQQLASDHILMNGTGTDIYGTADQGRFVYKQLSGNGSIIARVDRLDNTNVWAKAGVMIRETLDAGSSWAYSLASTGNGVHFQARLTTGAGATSDTTLTNLPTSQTTATIPMWVKVERIGNVFNAYYSTDGVTWTPNPWNPQTITMGANIYIGLAVTSHAAGVTTQAEFSSITTTGTVTGQWQSAALGIDQPVGNTPDTLYITVKDSNGHSTTIKNADAAAVNAGTWQQWKIPLSSLTGVSATKIKALTIGVGDRTNPKHGVGALFIDDIQFGHPAGQ